MPGSALPLTSLAMPTVSVKSLLPSPFEDTVVSVVPARAANAVVLAVTILNSVTTLLETASTSTVVPSLSVITSVTT